MQLLTDGQIRDAIDYVYEVAQVSDFHKKFVRYEWSNRLTSTAGKAMYRTNLIRLSSPVLGVAPLAEQMNTIVHEAAHMALYHKYGRSQKHNHVWKRLMVQCGYKPERCHSIDVSLIPNRKRKRYIMSCSCASGALVSDVVYNRITREGRQYSCGRCKQRLV